MTSRILSQHGNVIAADFRPKVNVHVKTQILYADELVYLARFTLLLEGRVIAVEHVTGKTPTV